MGKTKINKEGNKKMNKEQREQFLKDNWRLTTLNFKWSKNGVCRIYDRRSDKTSFYAGGYGYDKQGTCLAELINYYFNNEIKKLNADINTKAFTKRNGFYGLTHWNKKTKKQQKRSSKNTKSYVNGSCGFNCMKSILYKIGFKMEFVL